MFFLKYVVAWKCPLLIPCYRIKVNIRYKKSIKSLGQSRPLLKRTCEFCVSVRYDYVSPIRILVTRIVDKFKYDDFCTVLNVTK